MPTPTSAQIDTLWTKSPVPRSEVAQLFKDIVNNIEGRISILDCGGVADGVTPNDTAWATMLTRMKATGKPGYLPGSPLGWFNGAYAFTNSADLLENGLVVYCDGTLSTGIRALNPTKPVIRMAGEENGFRGGLTAHHRETPTSSTGPGIAFYKVFRPILEEINLYRVGWGIQVPAVNASTVVPDLGSGNYAFSAELGTVKVARYWFGALDLSAYNSASTGSSINNFYSTNEDGADVNTTLAAAPAQYQNVISLNAAPAPGQSLYLSTAGNVENAAVVSVTGAGPYSVTLDKNLDLVHTSGAAVRISRRFKAHSNPVRLVGCDEMTFNQLNIEGVYLSNHAVLVQDGNCVINALHCERVAMSSYQPSFIRVYGGASHVKLDAFTPVYCEFRQGGGLSRPYFSLGDGGSIDVTGIMPKGNLVENVVNMRLVWIDGTQTGIARLRGVKLDAATGNGSVPNVPAGTNSRAGLEFNVAYSEGDLISKPVFVELNERRYRWSDVNGRQHTWGTAAPTTGTWAVGDTVWNQTPAASAPMGWQCVTAGTPGTWKAMPSLAA